MLMSYFQITYIWSWDVASEQALRSWILSMPATIRTRVDGLSLEELHQLSGSVSSLPTSSVRTQTVRLFMPRVSSRALLTSLIVSRPPDEEKNKLPERTQAQNETANYATWK